MKTIEEIVKAIEVCAKDRMVALYTGHGCKRECTEWLSSKMPMRGYWIHWDGKTADSEPPIYVPVMCADGLCENEYMDYVETISVLCADIKVSAITGEISSEYVEGTDKMVSIDTGVSNDSVVLLCLEESFT